MQKGGCIYILTNKNKSTLYVGVTSQLRERIIQHKNKLCKNSFTLKYNLDILVYFEAFHSIDEAILREKQIKGGSRIKKEELINFFNPEWKDLFDELD